MLRTTTLLGLLLAPSVTAQDWPQFRGPGGLAVAADTRLPVAFGPGENVLWKTELPAGHSSPVVHGARIYLTGYEDGRDVVVALDRTDGTVVWRRSFQGEPHPAYYHADAVPALPTPCTDGERVVCYLEGYGLVALDREGELLWEHRLPHPGYNFGVGPSPILYEGIVILKRDGAPEAAILAYDVESGEEVWRIDRIQTGESHGTPFVWRNADRDELVLSSVKRVASYDLVSGDLLWFYDGTTAFPCTTPTADEDTLYFAAWSTPNASGRSFWEGAFGRSLEMTDEEIADPAKLFARLDADGDGHVSFDEVPECRAKDAFGFLDGDRNGTWEVEEIVGATEGPAAPGQNLMVAIARGAEGDASTEHVRWTWKRGLPYVASPLLHRGRVWLFKAGGIVTALDAKTGEPVFDRERLEDRSEYYLSPVGVGDRVLAGSAEGTLYVLDATADDLVVERTVRFEEDLFATPAVLDGTVYVRTKSTLWAFGGGAKQ